MLQLDQIIKKVFLPFIPSPLLNIYRKIKRHFVENKRRFGKTGNNIVEARNIQLNEKFLREKQVDTVKITQYLDWNNPFDTNDYGKYQYQEKEFSVEKGSEVVVEFNNFGLWTVEIIYYQRKRIVLKEVRTVSIEAPEYNIAYLSATLPTEIFLVNLWNITSEKCPTIVGLERLLFDYNALPENVFPFPLATEEELNTAYKGFYSYSQRMVFYISMLYKMNLEARLKLYLCDHQAFYSLAFMYSNGIPENNFNIYLLSDGTGSYEGFNYVFGNFGGEKTYNAMKNTWALAKRMAIKDGVQKWNRESFISCGNPSVSQMQKSDNHMIELSNRLAYAYVVTRENQNVRWILHDPKMLNVGDKTCFPLPPSIQKIDFVKCIKRLEQHKEELVKLLRLDCSVFEKSYSAGKKICICFASYPPDSADIKYTNATIKRFGKEFDYYFKEHPWISVNKIHKKRIENRGIVFLDPKIPIELYMLMEPNIYLAGYLSSAFLSIRLLNNPSEQILSVWDKTDCRIKTNCLDFVTKSAMNIENGTVIVYGR